MDEEEFIEFLCGALAAGCQLQLNKNLPEPIPQYSRSEADVRAAVRERQYAFLIEREDFTRYPVRLRPIEKGGQKLWYPRAVEGGPAIEIYFFAPFERDGRRVVPCSLISYQRQIISPDSGVREPAGPEVKGAFAELVKPLRLKSRKIRSEKREAYLTQGADRLLASGWRLASPFSA